MLCGNGTTHGSPNPLSPTIPTSPPSQALFLSAVAESENALAGQLFLADRERLGTVLQRGDGQEQSGTLAAHGWEGGSRLRVLIPAFRQHTEFSLDTSYSTSLW